MSVKRTKAQREGAALTFLWLLKSQIESGTLNFEEALSASRFYQQTGLSLKSLKQWGFISERNGATVWIAGEPESEMAKLLCKHIKAFSSARYNEKKKATAPIVEPAKTEQAQIFELEKVDEKTEKSGRTSFTVTMPDEIYHQLIIEKHRRTLAKEPRATVSAILTDMVYGAIDIINKGA